MGKINDSRKAALAQQLEHAVVEPAEEPGYFKVFVPGAIREFNEVTGADEAEAIAKVKANLESKIDQMPETSTGNVEIAPQNVKINVAAKEEQPHE